jgi:FixJ family two-component response regulator
MKILCVDDEPNILEAMESNLSFDYDVATAVSGRQGLDRMDSDGPFALVISDMRMPEMNGAAFLSEVKRRHPDTTRVLLTGYSEIDAAISAINDGSVFRFLTKPCPPEVLIDTVEEGLEQHRLRVAEKELLEGTVRGAVELLTDVLAMASPSAFARANDVKKLTADVAKAVNVTGGWDLEVAALLARLGWIALPPDVLERHLLGEPLADDEANMVAESSEVSARLVEHIPRLQHVAELIRTAGAPAAGGAPTAGSILGAALAVDLQISRGATLPEAVQQARVNISMRPAFLAAQVNKGENASWIRRKVDAEDLEAGLVLDEDVHLVNGNLIVKRDTELTAPLAARLHAFHRNMGLQEPIRVRVRAGHDLAL